MSKLLGRIKIGTGGYRLVYESRRDTKCKKCKQPILRGQRFTKAIGKSNPICTRETCWPVKSKILPYKIKTDPLKKWRESDWFDNVNGDALETCWKIVKAAGFEKTTKLNTSIVRMVGFKLQIIDKKLADRFIWLANGFLENKVYWLYKPGSLETKKVS